MPPRSYKVGVKTKNDRDWSSNMRRFTTRDEAERYGFNLARRWTEVTAWIVLESDDEPE